MLMEQRLAPRTEGYPPSVRPGMIGGRKGAELYITVATTNCSWGKCKFCGFNRLDGKHPPLSVSEAERQMQIFFSKLPNSERPKISKASVVCMTDSMLNPKTIEPDALKKIIEVSHNLLPNITEISIESWADMVKAPVLEELQVFLTNLFGMNIVREIATGIETASEEIRNRVGKGISDKQIEDLARTLVRLGWKLRGYFIYNLLERDDNVGALKRAVDFMARLRDKTKVELSILVLRGYQPKVVENTKLFKGFKDVSDEMALDELREGANYAKNKVEFWIDSVSLDQKLTGAKELSYEYADALIRYNQTSDPEMLCLT